MSVSKNLSWKLKQVLSTPFVLGTLGVLLFLACWEFLVKTRILPLKFLAAPTEILAEAVVMFQTPVFWETVGHTLGVVIVGWALAGVLGLVVGAIVGQSDRIYRYSMASIDVLRAIPGVTLAPVSVLLFGYAVFMEMFLVVFVAPFAVIVATVDGMRTVPPAKLDVARALQLSRFDTFRKITLPNAAPEILVSLRLALDTSLALALLAEMIGNPAGIGFALMNQLLTLQSERMFVYVIVTGLAGMLLNSLLMWIARRVLVGVHAAMKYRRIS